MERFILAEIFNYSYLPSAPENTVDMRVVAKP